MPKYTQFSDCEKKIRKSKQKYLILERRNILMRADGVLQISLFSLFIYVYICMFGQASKPV